MAVRKHRDEGDAPPVHTNVIEAPMVPRRVSVSDSLRGRRVECGLEIEYVAQILKIRPAVLIAIENGKFDELPGPAYAVGFVRSYATYLGLDAEALVVRFKTETAEIARRPHLEFPLPIRDSRVPTGPLLIICVLLAVLTYGGWYYLSAQPGQLADLTPTVPERLLHLLNLPPPQKAAPPRHLPHGHPDHRRGTRSARAAGCLCHENRRRRATEGDSSSGRSRNYKCRQDGRCAWLDT